MFRLSNIKVTTLMLVVLFGTASMISAHSLGKDDSSSSLIGTPLLRKNEKDASMTRNLTREVDLPGEKDVVNNPVPSPAAAPTPSQPSTGITGPTTPTANTPTGTTPTGTTPTVSSPTDLGLVTTESPTTSDNGAAGVSNPTAQGGISPTPFIAIGAIALLVGGAYVTRKYTNKDPDDYPSDEEE